VHTQQGAGGMGQFGAGVRVNDVSAISVSAMYVSAINRLQDIVLLMGALFVYFKKFCV